MTSLRWQKLKRLFEAALENEPSRTDSLALDLPAQRGSDLAAKVEQLLTGSESREDWSEQTPTTRQGLADSTWRSSWSRQGGASPQPRNPARPVRDPKYHRRWGHG